MRLLLSSLLILIALWLGTSVVLPTRGPAAQDEVTVVWRKTDEGWLRAEGWLIQRDYLYQEPSPPVYPMTILPMIVTLSIAALVLGQPQD